MEDIRANGRILYDSALHITPQAVKRNGLFKANSIILATSATVGEHALLLQDSLTNQRFTNFEIKDNLKEQLLPKFVFYYFFLIDEWCKQHLVIGNFPSVDVQQLINLPFPIPPLRVQARIVEILDKFTQLEAELEAELEARKKQYAYYRDQLLNFSQCPPLNVNIEWKTLGAIGTFYRGTPFQKKDFTSEGVGCIHYGEIYTHYGVSAQDTISKLSAKKANNARKANYGDLIIATTSENDEDVCKSVAWLGNESIVVSNDACYYQHALDPKYVAYFFLTNDFQQQKRAFIIGTKVRRVNPRDLAKIIIPIPPLSEQRRIVDILDRFDTLTNSISEGLPKEIALRRKQYEYYRDALLNFPRAEVTA